ncbi:MAG: hypothetical protein PHI89_07820 [Thiovulaceae bacterium]|jgi:hypothetical protein|nr:hypothetical protein [Sulfurimonadaceae bacterium]
MTERELDRQLAMIKKPIAIYDFIGDASKSVVTYKGRSLNFHYDENLAENVNKWLDNLPVITVEELKGVLEKYGVTLSEIATTFEDEELAEIDDIEQWVKIYNDDDYFLSIDMIDHIMKINKKIMASQDTTNI